MSLTATPDNTLPNQFAADILSQAVEARAQFASLLPAACQTLRQIPTGEFGTPALRLRAAPAVIKMLSTVPAPRYPKTAQPLHNTAVQQTAQPVHNTAAAQTAQPLHNAAAAATGQPPQNQ